MSQQIDLLRGSEPIGGRQAVRPSRKVEILAKDFTSVEQVVPVRLFWGTVKIAGVQVTPIFGFRNETVTQNVGGK
jgi:hypothetical protein